MKLLLTAFVLCILGAFVQASQHRDDLGVFLGPTVAIAEAGLRSSADLDRSQGVHANGVVVGAYDFGGSCLVQVLTTGRVVRSNPHFTVTFPVYDEAYNLIDSASHPASLSSVSSNRLLAMLLVAVETCEAVTVLELRIPAGTAHTLTQGFVVATGDGLATQNDVHVIQLALQTRRGAHKRLTYGFVLTSAPQWLGAPVYVRNATTSALELIGILYGVAKRTPEIVVLVDTDELQEFLKDVR